MKKIFTMLVAILALTSAAASAATLPDPAFILPGREGLSQVYGAQFMWGYYCPLEWVDPSANAERTVTMEAPNGKTYTYTFNNRIQENAPGEEEGTDEAKEPPYPNGILVKNFFNPETGKTWALRGYYTFTIPANLVYVTVDGQKIPNTEATLKYYCSGEGSTFFEEDMVKIIEPETDFVESLTKVVFKFQTSRDIEGWQEQLLCDTEEVPIRLTINGEDAGTVYGVISTDREHPNYVTVDMSSYKEGGTYEFTFVEGVVYQADGKKNHAVTFTLYVGMEDPASVDLVFTGVENAYELVTIYDNIGIAFYPETNIFNYPINILNDPSVTMETPIEYPIKVIAPEGLQENVDYAVAVYEDLNEDEEDINFAQIYFLTENTYGSTFEIQIGDKQDDNPDDNPDENGVNAIVTDGGEAVYFNLHGQRVVNPQKGIYIVNGKKVIL